MTCPTSTTSDTNALPIDAILKQLNQLRSQAGGETPAAPASAPVRTAPVAAQASAQAPTPTPAPTIAFNIPAPAPAPAPASAPVSAPAPAEAPAAAAPAFALHDTPAKSVNLTELWHQLADAVGRVSPFTRTYLNEAHPVSFEKNVLIIGFDPLFENKIALLDNPHNRAVIATKLSELGHPQAMVKVIKAEAPADWEHTPPPPTPTTVKLAPAPKTATAKNAATPKPAEQTTESVAAKKPVSVEFNKDEFKDDPLIKKALDVFKGAITTVLK